MSYVGYKYELKVYDSLWFHHLTVCWTDFLNKFRSLSHNTLACASRTSLRPGMGAGSRRMQRPGLWRNAQLIFATRELTDFGIGLSGCMAYLSKVHLLIITLNGELYTWTPPSLAALHVRTRGAHVPSKYCIISLWWYTLTTFFLKLTSEQDRRAGVKVIVPQEIRYVVH